jgi:hypothetical protein
MQYADWVQHVYSLVEESMTNIRGVLVPLVFISLHLLASCIEQATVYCMCWDTYA